MKETIDFEEFIQLKKDNKNLRKEIQRLTNAMSHALHAACLSHDGCRVDISEILGDCLFGVDKK